MAAELPRPGVEVVQQFRTVSPTVITPTLVPNVVGVAKQIVELFETSAAGANVLNGDALITLPAAFLASAAVGDPPVYSGLDGLALVLSINNAPNVTVTFSDPTSTGLTPATVVSQILDAFAAADATGATAEVVGTTQFRVRTLGIGDLQQLFIDATTAGAVLTAFGIGAGRTYVGVNTYRQYEVGVPDSNFPDPRQNLDELAIQPETIRVFLALGNGTDVRELSRTESFLRAGQVDDPVVVTGTVDLTTLTLPGDIQTQTLLIKVNGGATQTVTFTSGATSVANLLAELNGQTTGLVATAGAGDLLVITSDSVGFDSTIEIVSGSAVATLGLTAGVYNGVNIAVIDDGNGDVLSPIVEFAGEDFTSTGTAAARTGNVAITSLTYPGDLANKTIEISDGKSPQTITFSSTIANSTAVLAAINAVVSPASGGRITATLDGSNFLVLTNSLTGTQSMVQIVGGTAVATLGHTVGVTRGGASHVEVGDEVWVDGVLLGVVRAVAPGAINTRIKLDRQLTISSDIGKDFYIVATGLQATPASDRPLPDLIIAGDGSAVIKHDILRDTTGTALAQTIGRANIYLTYEAVRQDVSPLAKAPGLLRVDSVTQLESELAPINTQNPLALGLFFALANAPGVQVTGLGVDAVSSDAPFGTVEAYTRAAEFLEAYEVYAIAPLTNDQTVAQIFNTHASFMSEPANKGERVVLFNSKKPETELDTLVASGAAGNSSSATAFDTSVANLPALLLAASVNPVGTIPVSAGVYLDIASDSKRYSVSSVNGSVVTIRTSFNAGENEDNYYATTDLNDPPLPTILVNETFAIRIRGAALVKSDGTPDNQAIAETYQALSQTFLNRRFWHTMPDTCAATLAGVEQTLPGFYMNAGIAGMIGQQPAQQSFTNFPMAGYTRVIGSNDTFSERQLNIMAAGGTYIVVQDAQGAPLVSRMALTTDMTSVETRTDSITKVVDFAAKFLRRMLKNFIGRFNITQGFLDTLSSVIQGGLNFLVENGVLIGGNLNNIIQDEDAPDTVICDCLLDVPYPCNYIRLTLVI